MKMVSKDFPGEVIALFDNMIIEEQSQPSSSPTHSPELQPQQNSPSQQAMETEEPVHMPQNQERVEQPSLAAVVH